VVWTELLRFTRGKLITFIVLTSLMNLALRDAVCVNGLGFGYCLTRHGYPFTSITTYAINGWLAEFLLTGGVNRIPATHLSSLFAEGLAGLLGNTLLAYLAASLIFATRRKIHRQKVL